MSWTKFKQDYLLSVNVAIAAALILFQVRRDFLFHPLIIIWFMSACLSVKVRSLELRVLRKLGHLNSMIILTVFYFLVMTPFSVIYRAFYQNQAFQKKSSRYVTKSLLSRFDEPF